MGYTRSSRAGGPIPAILAILLNLYLAVFLADAGISVLDELAFALSGHHLLAWVRSPVAMFAVLGGPPVYLLAVLFQRVPRAIFVPLALFPPVVMLVGLPLAYWLGWENYGLVQVTAAQASLAVVALALLRLRTGRLWMRAEDLPEPSFALGPTLRMVAFSLVLVIPGTTTAFVGLCERCLVRFTGGFVDVRWDGLWVVERRYVRAESTVRLVGMMHIGDQSAYEAIAASFDHPDVLILAEGVSDDQGLLGEHLPYEAVAQRTGLVSQQPFETYRPGLHIRNADIDVSEMSESTLRYLRLTTQLAGEDGVNLAVLLELFTLSSEDPEADQEAFWNDVIDRRNAVLLEHLLDALHEAPVLAIPWGAAHLKGIEAELFDMGFELEAEQPIPLLTWGGA